MSEFAIQAEKIGKRYRLGVSNPLERLGAVMFPWMRRGGGAKGADQAGCSDFWALRDVSFRIRKGEAVGIIGHNGAGKSTLLKMLSRVTLPTTGHGIVRGRVGTLLEVGTGFQPDLTGRDNIFLSGILLGMRHEEVVARFDQIVEFAGIGEFLDTPVKRYSSGMYVRLAFAVASHLDPDVLILDEVLAVGDAAFQKRSLERLESTRSEDGRTVLFVSHNLSAIRNFCQRALVFDHGRLVFDGDTSSGIQFYLRQIQSQSGLDRLNLRDRLNRTSGAVRFYQVNCYDEFGAETWSVNSGRPLKLVFRYRCFAPVNHLSFYFSFRSALSNQTLTAIRESLSTGYLVVGECGEVVLNLPSLPLRANDYQLYVGLCDDTGRVFHDVIDQNVSLPILSVETDALEAFKREGFFDVQYNLESRRISDLESGASGVGDLGGGTAKVGERDRQGIKVRG